MILAFKNDIMKKYEMNNIDLLYYFLEIEINQREDGLFIVNRSMQKAFSRSSNR